MDDLDLAILKNNSITGRKSPQSYVIGDITRDGTIDDADMDAVMKNRNQKAGWRVDSATVNSVAVDSAVN